jgi:hypothetical protein
LPKTSPKGLRFKERRLPPPADSLRVRHGGLESVRILGSRAELDDFGVGEAEYSVPRPRVVRVPSFDNVLNVSVAIDQFAPQHYSPVLALAGLVQEPL